MEVVSFGETSEQNETESQQWGSFASRQPLSIALKLHTIKSNVLIELSQFEMLTKTPWDKTSKCHINNWQANTPVTMLLKKPIKTLGTS